MLRRINPAITFLVVLLPVLLSGQVEEWVYRYDGPAHSIDSGYSIVYGADGYLYVAGISYGNESGADIIVIKLDTAGTPCWVYRSSNPEYTYEKANQIVYGADNNLYIAGLSGLSYGNDQDFVVVSIDTAGNERWVKRYNGTGQGTDYEEANSLIYYTAGSQGYIYAAGTTAPGSTDRDFTVERLYDFGFPAGEYLYNGTGNSADVARSIVLAPDTNLYVAGYAVGYGYEDFAIISLDANLNERWVWTDQIASTNLLQEIVCSDNAVFACGITYSPPYDLPRFVVVSVSFSGFHRWTYLNSNPYPGASETATSLVLSNDKSNVFITGGSGDESQYERLAVISLKTANGEKNWFYTYPGTGNSTMEYGTDIVISPLDILYTVGSSFDNAIIVVSLDTQGSERWVYEYSGPGSTLWNGGYSIAYGSDNRIYLAGASGGIDTQSDLTVICLRDTLIVNVEEENQNPAVDGQTSRLEVYPNPSNGIVHITYSADHRMGNVSLKIYDASGRVVKTFHSNLDNSVQSLSWDGKDDSGRAVDVGIYFVQVKAGDHTVMEKVILLR